MKVNKIMQECRELITPEIKRNVELSVFIANRILEILTEKNMTQREFAKRLHKSESEICVWLTGLHTFTTKTISKIEIALGEEIITTKKEKPKAKFIDFVYITKVNIDKNSTSYNNNVEYREQYANC